MDPSHGSFPGAKIADVRPPDGSEGSRNSTIIRAVKDIAFGSVSGHLLGFTGRIYLYRPQEWSQKCSNIHWI